MIRALSLRLTAAIGLTLLPSALLLIICAANHTIPAFWVLTVLALSVMAGGAIAILTTQQLGEHHATLQALAEALDQGRVPDVFPNPIDPLAPVERIIIRNSARLLSQVEALSEERDELETVLRSMTEAVVVTTADGAVVMLNGAARDLFALNPNADYTRLNFIELCRDPKVAAFLARSMNTPEESVISTEIDIQNPAPRTLRLSVAPIQRPKRSRAARVLVFHDISQLKAYENQRADFVANVTHELRTPLSSLCGYAETLLKGVDDPESSRRFLAIIERQSQRLSRLIDDLLVLSDLERGLSPLKLEQLDAKRLIEEACEVMRPQAEKQEIALTVECEEGIPPLAADRDRLQQVLLNLLDNGIKYTPRGGKVVGAARIYSNGNGGGAGVELIVRDTGEGIPASHIPRLTERFYRVDRARSRELGGTGLGLAIVKHIVQLHHGRLTIESRVREGTTVRVWLPCASVHTEIDIDSVIRT